MIYFAILVFWLSLAVIVNVAWELSPTWTGAWGPRWEDSRDEEVG